MFNKSLLFFFWNEEKKGKNISVSRSGGSGVALFHERFSTILADSLQIKY